MPPFKKLLKPAAIFCVVYVALALLWPVWGGFYGAMFRTAGNSMFASFGPQGKVRFDRRWDQEASSHRTEDDTTMFLAIRNPPVQANQSISSKRLGYTPLIVFAAFAAATPLPWNRRAWLFMIGAVLVNLFVACRVWLMLRNPFTNEPALKQFDSGPYVSKTISYLANLFDAIQISYVAPGVIWMLVVVLVATRQDVLGLAGGGSAVARSQPRHRRAGRTD
ncbi:MAG: hypothetical protein IID36_10710 [Planctomycetes bacterium]|nr:hypothetical protein [Planctomycetota bacterium]